MSLRIVTCLAALSLTLGCDVDVDPDARARDIESLADPDLDPEIRASIEAELAEDDDATPLATIDELDDGSDLDGTCFFCPSPQPIDPGTYTPVVQNPSVSVNAQGNTILFVQAASSFIVLPGATVRLQVPGGGLTYGPYALSYDVSGTLIRANVSGGFPAASCRTITITNPNNKTSAPVTHCR